MADATTAPAPTAPTGPADVPGFSPEKVIARSSANLQETAAAERKAATKFVTETEGERKSFDEVISGLRPPQLGEPPKMEQVQQTNPAQAWGSAAMIIAAFASAFTRTPLTTAMNSAAAALNAFRTGDEQRATAAFTKWKLDTDNFYKAADYQMQQYQALLRGFEDRAEMDEKVKVAQWSALASAFGDTTMANVHSMDAAMRIMEERDRFQQTMMVNGDKVTQTYTIQSAWKDWQAKHPNASPAESAEAFGKIMRDSGHQWTDQEVDAAIERSNRSAAQYAKASGYQGAINNVDRIMQFDLTKPPNAGEVIQQASALDAYIQTINGNRAIRGFQLRLLQDDAGLYNNFQLMLQKVGQGGPVTRDMIQAMQKLAADYTHVATLNYADFITKQQWTHHKVGLDPTEFVPPDFDEARDPLRGTYPQPSQQAQEYLRANDTQDNWVYFDERYGQGAAAQVFSGGQ